MYRRAGTRKEWGSVVSVCLLVTAGFIGFVTFQSDVVSAATTWYVGSGPMNDSTTINGGIALASDSETVFVYSGTYIENVMVDKTINLTGESQHTTIVDSGGSGDVVHVISDWVNITGFTVTGGGSGSGVKLDNVQKCRVTNNNISNSWAGIYLFQSESNNIIGNNASKNNNGIYLFQSNKNNITDNTVILNDEKGISLQNSGLCKINDNNVLNNKYGLSGGGSYENIITGNNFSSNTNGIHLSFASSGNNIKMNNVSNNDYLGMDIHSSIKNIITDNNIFSNPNFGIRIRNSAETDITNNSMIHDGIFIEGDSLEYWNTHNIDTSNTVNGKPVYYWKNQTGGTIPPGAGQVILANCINVIVENQELTNGTVGVELGFSFNNHIIGNNASSNDQHGIHLYSSNGNDITDNNIFSNYMGIDVKHSLDNKIISNNISYNGYGTRLYYSDGHTLVTNNFTRNYDSIFIRNSNGNTITGNNASSNDRWGIFLEDSDGNFITNNNISSNNWNGIAIVDSRDNFIISNNVSLNTDEGILLLNSDLNFITGNNIFWNNRSGISLWNSNDITITDNNISSNVNYGMDFKGASSNTIDTCTINNNPTAVHFDQQSTDNIFINCSISNSGAYDFHFDNASGGDSHATTLNTIFDKTKVYYGDTLSDMTVKWFMHVDVIYSGGIPASYADIWVNDSYGTSVFEGQADANGWVRWLVVTEYLEQDMNGDHIGERTYYTPHDATATDGSLWGYALPNMDISKVVLIILGTPPPLLPPTNLTTKVVNGGNNIELEWEPSPSLDHYLVYRADSATEFDFAAPYNSSLTWPYPINTTWVDPDSSVTAVDDDFYYIVRAANFDESVVSATSNTAGVWSRTFEAGISTFSLPLEPFEARDVAFHCQDMNASYIKWMNTTTHTWTRHDRGDSGNNTLAEVGEGYEIGFLGKSIQTKYTFTGLPGAMITFDNDILFSGFDPDSEAKNLTVSIEPDGNVTLTWQEPASMGPGDWYEVYYSNTRDGFFGTLGIHYFPACPSIAFGTNTTTISGLGASDPGARLYLMVVPFNSLGIRGASSYSVGIWTEEYLAGYDTFGIPLKLNNDQAADWYCDNIPSTVGINYYIISEQRWAWHSTRMPQDVYDPVLSMVEGYQISTSSVTKYSFIGT